MHNTIEYFLTEYKTSNKTIEGALKELLPNNESWKVIKNSILESELITSISYMLEVPVLSEKNILLPTNIVDVDNNIKNYYNIMNNSFLIDIATNHFSPIYRVGAFALDIIETMNKERNK